MHIIYITFFMYIPILHAPNTYQFKNHDVWSIVVLWNERHHNRLKITNTIKGNLFRCVYVSRRYT